MQLSLLNILERALVARFAFTACNFVALVALAIWLPHIDGGDDGDDLDDGG